MAKAVFCVASSEFQAEAIVNEAKVAGFADDEISVLLPDKTGALARDWPTRTPNVGAGALGWLASIGPVNIPGLGLFIAAGPITTALAGALPGGVFEALSSMGLPEGMARLYEQKIIGGNILIYILTENLDQTNRAKAIFDQAAAANIAVTGEVERLPSPPEIRGERWERW